VIGGTVVVVGRTSHSEHPLQLFLNAHFCDHSLLSFAHQTLQSVGVDAGAAVGAGGTTVVLVGETSHSEHPSQLSLNAHLFDHSLPSFAHQFLQLVGVGAGAAVGAGGTTVDKGATVVAGATVVVVRKASHSGHSLQLLLNEHFCDHCLLSFAHQTLQSAVGGATVNARSVVVVAAIDANSALCPMKTLFRQW
jgi:hypothetical protein